jgi:hypothetical protein
MLDEDVPAFGNMFPDVAVSSSASKLVVSNSNNTNHFILI